MDVGGQDPPRKGASVQTTRDHKRVEGELHGEERRAYFRALLDQIAALEQMLEAGMFERGVHRIGCEQEIFLVDRAYHPAPAALSLLDRMEDPRFTTELGLFNLEMNGDPQPFDGTGLSAMESQLSELLEKVRGAGEGLGVLPVLAGILPTIEKSDLGLHNMVPSPRYQALNQVMMAVRGEAFDFSIRGIDDLTLKHDSVMVEACNASFQVHLQLAEPERFAALYNLSQALLGPVLAVSTNSPVLFGRRLWAETRIALFEQSCDVRTPGHMQRDAPGRVSFGLDWLRGSVVDLYRENVCRFRPLVRAAIGGVDGTEALAAGQIPELRAVRLHNGTIYRWNRPCYGISENGLPHLRIELRVLPSGPTIADEVAGAALWLGLMRELGETMEDIADRMNHDDARSNLYAAARDGVRARLTWMDGEEVLAQPFLLDRLLPLAESGLHRGGVAKEDIDRYLGIVDRRVRALRTGAQWTWMSLAQMKKRGSPGKRAAALTAAMVARQRIGQPVSEWAFAEMDEHATAEGDFQKVSQLMVSDIYTVGPDDPVELVSELMAWVKVRYVPVEDDRGELVGLVSYRAVLRHLTQAARGAGEGAFEVPVSAIMRANPVTVSPDTPTRDAVGLMLRHRIGSLPVVQGPHIVGILTEEELVGVAAKVIEAATAIVSQSTESTEPVEPVAAPPATASVLEAVASALDTLTQVSEGSANP